MRGVTLISIVLAPSWVYSFSSEALDDQDSIPVAIDFQEAFNKTSSFVGAILNRDDGTSCGLIVENGTPLSSTGSVGSHSPALTLKEELRQTLAQNNIPPCSSAEDFQRIAQADLSKIDLDQIFFEDDSVQVAGLGKFLFSSPLRTALTSITGTCLFALSSWAVTFFLPAKEMKYFVRAHNTDLLKESLLLVTSVFVSGGTSIIIPSGIMNLANKADLGGVLSRGRRVSAGIASFVAGIACQFFGRYPTVILLDSIVD